MLLTYEVCPKSNKCKKCYKKCYKKSVIKSVIKTFEKY